MTSLVPRARSLLPTLAEWFDETWPFGEHNIVRIEESVTDRSYTVRAELPGFDPKKDVHVTTDGGLLTISAEREAKSESKGHTEFRYGSFSRTVSLPSGCDTKKIAAKYVDGILEVSMPFKEKAQSKQTEVPIRKD